MKPWKIWWFTACTTAFALIAVHAAAFPALMLGKSPAERVNHSTHIAIMQNARATVVTWMADYEGPLEPFALVTVVPQDVTPDRLVSLKRDFLDHLDRITAPRFHEFWEMEPCEPGQPQQEWERDLSASEQSAFLGGGPATDGKKVAKELFLNVSVEFKQGEYTFLLLDKEQNASAILRGKGYAPGPTLDQVLEPYAAAGAKVLIIEVDPKRIELVGGDRAQLSPIQYWTSQALDTVPLRLGLANAPRGGKQEVVVYFLHPESRFETKNYPTRFAPTNVLLDFSVKEKMGEFYGALHDRLLEKFPKSWLTEYAWSAEECGQPCVTTPLAIHELLALGGHVFEDFVPAGEKHPKPEALTEEQENAFKALLKALPAKERPAARKAFEDERRIIAERKALVGRHKYMLSRLHYRFDAAGLPEDPRFGAAAGHVEGGVALPVGPKGESFSEVRPSDKSRYQARFNNLHPTKVVANCAEPVRNRWGRAPRTYRGLRKIWIAEDLTRKNRTKVDLAKVVLSPITDLGLPPPPAPPLVPKSGGPTGSKGCATSGLAGHPAGGLAALLLAGFGLAWKRRRYRKGS